jgi:hypothetical protein
VNKSRLFPASPICLALTVASLGLALGCGGTQTVAAPTVTAFSPGSGPVNTVVTVTGSGYANGITSVSLGGVAVPSSSGSILSDTQITFPVPTAAVTGTITVVTAGGSASSATMFLVAPGITSLSAVTGSASGKTPITVTGTGLMGISQILFGTVAATPTTQTANQIVVPVPSTAPTGPLTVTFVVNPSYAMANLLSSFTVTP